MEYSAPNPTASHLNRLSRWALRFTLVLCWLYPIAVAYWHRISEVLVPAMGVSALFGSCTGSQPAELVLQWQRLFRAPLTILVVILLGYIAASTMWSFDPAYAAITFVKTLAVIILTTALGLLLVQDERVSDTAKPIAMWLSITVAVGLLAAAVEVVTDGFFSRIVYGWRRDPQVNGGIAILTLLIWPCLGFLTLQLRYAAAAALWLFAGIVAILSPDGASVLGYAAGSAIAAIALLSWRCAIVLAVAAAEIGLLVAPLLGRLCATILTPSLMELLIEAAPRHRIQLWLLYGDLIPRQLTFGWGFAGARFLGKPDIRGTAAPDLIVEGFEPGQPLDVAHSHNVPLQIWVEFGIIGVALTAVLMAFIAFRMRKRSSRAAPLVLASTVAIYAQCYVSYSIWETWWFSALAFVVVLTVWLSHAATKSVSE